MLEGEIHVMKRPDVDNNCKSCSRRSERSSYKDDTQIVFVAAKKAYSAEEGLDIRGGGI